MKSLTEEHFKMIVIIEAVHDALAVVNQEFGEKCQLVSTGAQKSHNGRTNALSSNKGRGGYGMIRSHKRRMHKLLSEWKGPLRLKEINNHLTVS